MHIFAIAIVIGILGKREYNSPQYTQNMYTRLHQLNEEKPS
jgi:hypothetical protein